MLWDLKTHLSQDPQPKIVILNGQIRYRSAQFFSVSDTQSKEKIFLPLIPNSIHLFGIHQLREGVITYRTYNLHIFQNFDFAEFVTKTQLRRNNQESPSTGSNHSTRNGSPDEPILTGLSTSTQNTHNRSNLFLYIHF